MMHSPRKCNIEQEMTSAESAVRGHGELDRRYRSGMSLN